MTTHWKQSVMYLDEPVPVEQDARILGNIVLSPGQKHKRCLDVTLTYRVEDETDVTKIYYMGPEENS